MENGEDFHTRGANIIHASFAHIPGLEPPPLRGRAPQLSHFASVLLVLLHLWLDTHRIMCRPSFSPLSQKYAARLTR